eukprot:7083077-Heterocapsa_arctica.AAC.1
MSHRAWIVLFGVLTKRLLKTAPRVRTTIYLDDMQNRVFNAPGAQEELAKVVAENRTFDHYSGQATNWTKMETSKQLGVQLITTILGH